jgi:hypothetical protein
MALRDQPYFPLYVNDYLTDEKLSCCSLASQGVYIRLLCLFHKSDNYGGILFKQTFKQNLSTREFFAFILSKQSGIQNESMVEAIDELLFYEVIHIGDIDGVPFLYQKRMVKDYDISFKRSECAKKGGGNPNLKKKKDKNLFKQNSKQNTENEYEYEYENESVIINKKKGVENLKNDEMFENQITILTFDEFWTIYDKKVGEKEKLRKKFDKLSEEERSLICQQLPRYIQAQPDKQYRKNPETYLNNKSWNDEIIEENGTHRKTINSKPSTEKLERLAGIVHKHFGNQNG